MPKLTTLKLRALTAPGLYGDGGNLWVQVRSPTQRSWLFRYMLAGKALSMGLGPVADVTLAEARQRAAEARKLLHDGIDPRQQRDALQAAARAASDRAVSFAQAAQRYIAAHEPGWRSAKHRSDWRASLTAHALPILGSLPVGTIDTAAVLRVLEPIWTTTPETASRVRGRIEVVLDFAKARGWRPGENPAAWRGHLALMLPSKRKVRPVVHHAALDWREAPAFMAELRGNDSIEARALQFVILTAARSGEVRGAVWDEIDMESAIWTIPAERMKTRKAHRVPLSQATLDVLRSLELLRTPAGLVFPNSTMRRPLTDGALKRPLRTLNRTDITVHGFRSMFRDYCAEATHYLNHVVEQALAHTIGNAVEAAYRRGDLFAKRVALMDDWAAYLAQPAADVVELRPGVAQAAGG